MDLFWLEYHDLPEGVGFGLHTPKHFLTLAVCALVIVLLCLWFGRLSWKKQEKALKFLPLLMLAGNLLRDVYLLIVGYMSIAYLPLHLCSSSIFAYLLYAFLPEEIPEEVKQKEHLTEPDGSEKQKARRHRLSAFRTSLGEVSFVLLMPGSVTALIFPDWTNYPLFNFMCLHSFFWHTLIACYPMLLLISGRIHPTIKHLWYPFLYLAIITPPIALFDYKENCNYLFVHWPVQGTPLESLYNLMGSCWRVGYAVLVFAVILVIYLVIELAGFLIRRIRKAAPKSQH